MALPSTSLVWNCFPLVKTLRGVLPPIAYQSHSLSCPCHKASCVPIPTSSSQFCLTCFSASLHVLLGLLRGLAKGTSPLLQRSPEAAVQQHVDIEAYILFLHLSQPDGCVESFACTMEIKPSPDPVRPSGLTMLWKFGINSRYMLER